MGTDIHPIVQVRIEEKWVDHEWPSGAGDYDWEATEDSPLATRAFMGLQARNYALFAILAGVRNGIGFAGCKTGEAVEPIAEQRGLPGDYIDKDDTDLDSWLGDHSFTWMTLQEILDWLGWGKPLVKCGMVRMAAKRDDKGRPLEWCGEVFGKDAEDYEHEEWKADLKESVGWFWTATVPYLKSLATDPKDVRLVMGFDS